MLQVHSKQIQSLLIHFLSIPYFLFRGQAAGAMLPKTHQESRASLCIGCHKLGSTLRKISPKSTLLTKVQQNIYDGFSVSSESLPNVICDGCRKTLSDIEKVKIYLKFLGTCSTFCFSYILFNLLGIVLILTIFF